MARKPYVSNHNTLVVKAENEVVEVRLPIMFSARLNSPLRDNKGAIIYGKATARTYRRSFDGQFGKVKKDFSDIMSRGGKVRELPEDAELNTKITYSFNPTDVPVQAVA